ncbi:MAG: hypothetical protein HQ475_04360 [SAR202 cluster bacterium]|nr:hypothetical protein [SAR202 cluster bacterium]
MIARITHRLRSGISSFFSSRVEDSFRLRGLTLAGLWVAAIGLSWVGGDLKYCITGGVFGTVGHLFSFKMRTRSSRLLPFLISGSIIAISIFMRNDMVKTFNGDWIPIGQYLILVCGLAAYDVRTRGGLYTGLVLSGMVLFFASQQAFDYSFGVFVVGFLAVLMAFMVMSFLEDMIRAAKVYWTKNHVETGLYWTGAICAMFMLAGLVFWILPRGENNLVGPPQLAVLPYSETDIDTQWSLQDAADLSNPSGGAQSDTGIEGALPDGPQGSGGNGGLDGSGPENETTPRTSTQTGDEADGSSINEASGSGADGQGSQQLASQADNAASVYTPDGETDSSSTNRRQGGTGQPQQPAQVNNIENRDDPIVFHVRSNVASYWRGLIMEDYDGTRWFINDYNNKMIESPRNDGTWYNKENDYSVDTINYQQTFFLRGTDQLPLITGYRALQVVSNDEQNDQSLLGSGASYRVISSLPKHSPDQLRRDTSSGFDPVLAYLPGPMEKPLVELADKIVAGASSDLEKVARIISYVNDTTNLAPRESSSLASIATLDEFLFQGVQGSITDYAAATVLLVRAANMPARMAVGYLPGTRDPLTGTYRVRESDRHAWAEVEFVESGWVPFDGAPRKDTYFGERPVDGIARLFQSGAGENIYATLKEGPQDAFRTLINSVPGPLLWSIGPAIIVLILVGRWFTSNSRRRQTGPGASMLPYGVIPGDGRREMKKLYKEVERLIRRHAGTAREGWQTAGNYASYASNCSQEIDTQLSWFTQAIWLAAYRTGDLHTEMVSDGRRRLTLLKEAFKASDNNKTSFQS